MKQINFFLLLIALLFAGTGMVFAQTGSIKGRVLDGDGNGLAGANVSLKGTSQGSLTDADGNYEITRVRDGSYTVVASFIGFKSMEQQTAVSGGGTVNLDFTLADDLLNLDAVVVTGTFNPQSKLESTVAITTLDQRTIEQQAPRSTGELIDAIPGFYVESNGGEVGNNIYPRGLPIGTGSFRYTSLREDGLNTFEISDKVFFNADGFTKVDLTVDRVEGVRGGNSVIFASNTPGGIINFVSKTGGPELKGDIRYTYGTQKLYRVDANVGGPLTEDKRWRFNVGGFYRYDNGLRDFTGPANVGGQIKMNVTRLFDNEKGYVRFYGKMLSDRLNSHTPVAYQGFDKPREMPGGPRMLYGNYVPSTVGDISIPDPILSTPGNPQFRRVNADSQFDVNYNNIGMELFLDLGSDWKLTYQTRYINLSVQANSFQVVANPTGGGNLLASVFALPGGAAAYIPRVFYTNPSLVNQGNNYPSAVQTGEDIPLSALGATTNPNPAVNGYFASLGITPNALGLNTSGINGNGQLLPIGLFVVTGRNTNFMNNIQFTKQAGNHSLTFGAYLSQYNSDEYWNFNTVLMENKSDPRLVDIQFVPIAGGAPFELTRGGVLGANFQYEQSNSKNITLAGFIGDEWKVTDQLTATLGLRYEINQATGALQNTGRRDGRTAGFIRPGSPITIGIGGSGGLDGNALTLYDNNSDIPVPTYTNYDNLYDVWGANLGFNYKLNDNSAVFLNGSRGSRYANSQNFLANKDQGIIGGGTTINAGNVATLGLGNTSNIGSVVNGTAIPISLRNPVEKILQGEAGYRLGGSNFGLTASVFYSKLTDAPFTLQSTDPATGNIKLDVLLYDVRNIGGELEIIYAPIRGLRINGALSIQNPVYTDYAKDKSRPVLISEVDPADNPAADDPEFVPGAPASTRQLNLNDKKVERIPPIQADLTVDYTINRFNIYVNGRFIGKRQANRRNTYQLPAFVELAAGMSYRFSNRFIVAAQGINLLNSIGIVEGNNRTQDNFGPNAVKNNDLINTGSFILPRSANIMVTYSF